MPKKYFSKHLKKILKNLKNILEASSRGIPKRCLTTRKKTLKNDKFWDYIQEEKTCWKSSPTQFIPPLKDQLKNLGKFILLYSKNILTFPLANVRETVVLDSALGSFPSAYS
jgi:hypothetical protein